MSSETVVNEIGAVQCFPSDHSERSRIRECDSHLSWKTNLSQTRGFEFTGERGHPVRGAGLNEIDSRSITLRPARLAAS